MATSDPITPPDVLAQRKRQGWKPDNEGRLLFRPKGLYGAAYVVETPDQLDRIEKFERTKMMLMVVVAGAVFAAVFAMQSSDDEATALGSMAVVSALVAGLVVYVLAGGTRIATQTAMRARLAGAGT